MEELIKNLIETIDKLNCRDFWDYAAIIVPAVTAIISTGISIFALCNSNKYSKQQNRIALFDKKYRVAHILDFLLPLARIIIADENENRWLPLDSAAESYISGTTLIDTISNRSDYSSFYTGIIIEAGKIEFLFKDKDIKIVLSFLESLNTYIANCYSGKGSDKDLNQLKQSFYSLEKSGIITRFNISLKLN